MKASRKATTTKKRDTEKKRKVALTTHINVVLDRSGSMAGMEEATIKGFNQFIAEQRSLKADNVRVTVTLFDTELTTLYTDTPLDEVPTLTATDYFTRGMTALYDAIGITTRNVQTRVQPDERLLVLIMTDGMENSSREFTQDKIKTFVKGLEAKGNVTFTFIGGNLDSIGGASALGAAAGIAGSNTLNNSQVTPHTHAMSWNVASNATQGYRGSSAMQSQTFYGAKNTAPDLNEVLKQVQKQSKKQS